MASRHRKALFDKTPPIVTNKPQYRAELVDLFKKLPLIRTVKENNEFGYRLQIILKQAEHYFTENYPEYLLSGFVLEILKPQYTSIIDPQKMMDLQDEVDRVHADETALLEEIGKWKEQLERGRACDYENDLEQELNEVSNERAAIEANRKEIECLKTDIPLIEGIISQGEEVRHKYEKNLHPETKNLTKIAKKYISKTIDTFNARSHPSNEQQKSVTQCSVCGINFGFVTNKCVCDKCRKVMCEDCRSKIIYENVEGIEMKYRVCLGCFLMDVLIRDTA